MEPGKIPHEIRHGELAQLGILPFQPYYGTHDATSLYVIVLSYLYQWLGDVEVLRALPAERGGGDALDRPATATATGDGFQEYRPRSTHGYYNQGWKDAGDAIPHADGTLAPLPLATCELQGYVYDAKLRMADIYEILGRPARRAPAPARGHASCTSASTTRSGGRPRGPTTSASTATRSRSKSVASNAGHCLPVGIVPPERAGRVVERLLADDMWSGWGIRTLSSDHPAYNPFSYHTGSRLAARQRDDRRRLPALRLRRRGGAGRARHLRRGRALPGRVPPARAVRRACPGATASFPVQYLGANVPQAWAAGSILRLIAILCGIHATTDAGGSRLYVNPALPDWLPEVTIRNLRAGRGSIDLAVRDGTIEVLANTSGFEVIHGPAPRPDAPDVSAQARSAKRSRPPKTATQVSRESRTASSGEATRRSS